MLRKLEVALFYLGALACLFICGAAQAQDRPGGSEPARITQRVDDDDRVVLEGSTRREVHEHDEQGDVNDHGDVNDDLMMEHMFLQLRRSPEQESALQQFINELHTVGSPNFHQWIGAQEFGQRFGVAAQDLETITGWLKSHGFQVNVVYSSAMVIDFSGTAQQVSKAFHTNIHNLEFKGKKHTANVNDPQIPAALAPAIVGIVSLHDFQPRAMHQMLEPKGNYTFSSLGATYAMVPSDLATIYNLNPLFGAGYAGQGQTIALIEDTNVYRSADWTTFRSKFGLSGYSSGSFKTIHPAPSVGTNNCSNPGVIAPNDAEAILDAEWASAAAPGATLVMASCADTSTTFGGLIAIENLINSSQPPAIMSISYGQCETENGASANVAYNVVYQQAVAEGVSVFVAAGDSGAAACDNSVSEATHGVGANAFASTPYNVAVGGTDFSDTYAGTNSIYWNSTNTSTFASARSYIPEIPWNDSCAGQLVSNYEGYGSTYGTNSFCNSDVGAFLQTTVAGGGGPSGCATGAPSSAGVVSGSCAGWPKPSWQSILGNPNDGVRDTPDVSLFAADGLWSHYYVFCWSDTANGGAACSGAPSGWSGAGGTSFASPIMAGVQALINQKTGSRQGNPNPVYYQLAATQYNQPGTSCNSANGNGVAGSCIFYDVTQGDADVNCTGSFNCYQPSGPMGVLSTSNQSYSPAYGTTGGWDFATGIGSINAANLVNNWPTASSLPVLTITKSHIGSFTQGQQNATYTVTVSNSAVAAPTSGVVTVTETLPSGLTLASMAGTGWTCAANTCTRSDVLGRGANYPAIAVTVNVAANASSPQVNQVSVSGGGSATAGASDSTALIVTPAAPTGLSAIAFSGEVSLSWNLSTGATGYNVLRSTTSGGSYTPIVTGLAAANYTDTSVTNGAAYFYVVQAANAAGTSGNSNQASATPSVVLSWQNGYAYRRVITIDHTKVPNTDQLNFPFLIAGTFPYLAATANGGNVTSANGYDIIFTSDASGKSPLPYERESYASNGAVNFWVQVPVVSHSSDTLVYMFYGNSSVTTDQTNRTGTWSSNYRAVWHLPNGTTLSGADSTSNAANGTNSGLTATAGLIGGAASGDGGGGHQINTSNNPYASSVFSSSGLTLSAWVKPVSDSAISQVVSLEGAYVLDVTGGKAGFEINGSGSDLVSAASVPNGGWTYIVGTSDSAGNLKLYVNGVPDNTASQSFFNLDTLTRTYSIGGHPTLTPYNFNGIIDEARISNVARSADWIATEYYNQSGSNFYTVGAAGSSGGAPFAPNGLSAISGNGQVSLLWNSSTGATSYNVLRSTTSGGPYTAIVTALAATNFTDTSVTNGTTYYYVVQGVNTSGTSPNSSEAVATPCSPPAVPTGLLAIAGNAQVSLTWNASSGAVGYNVKRSTLSGGPYTTIASDVTLTSYSDSGVANGTTYYYVVSAVSGCGLSGNSPEASAIPSAGTPWPNGYAYRRVITIDHTKVPNTDQLNFPFLIAGTFPYLAATGNGGNVTSANGYDIIFTSDASGNSPLPYERESYASNGAVNFWVQVPVVSHSSDTLVYMFYGNSSVTTDQTNRTGTWNSNYRAVWHLPNGTTLSGADSTSNAANGTNSGLTATAGLIGGAASGDGGGGHQINTSNNPYASSVFSNSGLTLSAWVKPVSDSAISQVVSLEGAYVLDVTGGKAGFEINGSGSDLVSAASVPNGGWTYIVGTSDSSGNLKLYVNGVPDNTASQSFFNLDTLTRTYSIGGHPTLTPYNFNGIIDEARISNVARSADWIATEYYNQNASSNFYFVGAASASGNGPLAPSGVTATAGNAQVSLSWNSSTGATSYNLLRSTTTGGPYTSIVAALPATTYTDTSVTSGTAYYYVIQAVNAAGTSQNSNEASATPYSPPAAPAGLSAIAGNAQVSLSWSFSSGANNYNVLRSTTTGGPYTSIIAALAATTYTDTGVTNGTTYYYVVQAVSSAGASPNSSEASATPSAPPAAPAGLSAIAGNAQVSLSWSSSTGATSYNVLRSTTTGGPYTSIVAALAATTYADTGVINGTTYYYVVQAVNSAGASPNSSEVTATPYSPPAVPTGVSATSGNAQVSLSWNSSTGATSYNVLRSTTSGGPYASIVAALAATTYTDTGLTNGTAYFYVVQAVNAVGTSPNSSEASATPQGGFPNGYAYRRAVTIDHTKVPNTDQLNFPVLIAGNFPYLAATANGGCVTNANGYDIIFTSDATGNSPLPYERESYASNGAVNFWVQVPVVSHSSNTVIYMFYGKSSVTTDQANRAGAWDSNFRAVWHLPNGTGVLGADSSSNGVNGTNSGLTMTTGLIGGAASGDGGGGHQINTGNNPYASSVFSSNGLTLSAWVKPVSNSAISQIVSLEGAYVIDVNSGKAGFEINGSGTDLLSTASVPTGNWTYIVGTSDSSGNLRLYVNGVLNSSASQAFYNLDWLMRPYSIGGHPVYSPYNFNGVIDEARISNMARSADWIATEFNNQSSSNFFTVGAAATTP